MSPSNPNPVKYVINENKNVSTEGSKRPPESYDREIHGKDVAIKLVDGSELLGKANCSKYWIKLEQGGIARYLNKAHIIEIRVIRK
ncbi:MAG: hypothetical protein QXJ48_03875 [Candidatus Korarchaeum sp.]